MEQKQICLSLVAGANLKRLLIDRGLSQNNFAYNFGVDARTVRRWISNGINSIDTIQQIANFFSISVLDILSL